ncbi:MAG: DNA replication/repair protein RecF [Propionibacteriaceae bacterium]|nr:DNA replication/repair protein RecF [Propionibacteriaceae bacterium]
MFVTHLSLTDFRNHAATELDLVAGVNVFVGANGQGKTNLVEAVEYLSTMSSHRVSSTVPLIRAGAESAILRATVQASREDERLIQLELEVTHGRSNVARLNRAPLPRPRDLVGALRTVVFSPMDLAIVRGDPADRRAWLDTLVTTRWPRMAGVRADLDKILKQRNSLLKAMSGRSLRQAQPEEEITLQAWNEALARIGAELLHARLDTLADVLPHAVGAYRTIAPVNNTITAHYKTSLNLQGIPIDDVRGTLEARLLAAMEDRRRDEIARGVTLIGPQRDDIELGIGELAAKGYASHGESWSLALALKLGGFQLVRSDGTEPVLVLDDVFAELDTDRRQRLAGAIADAEQVLITAAVGADVPDFPSARRFRVEAGTVELQQDRQRRVIAAIDRIHASMTDEEREALRNVDQEIYDEDGLPR